ncbi:MAG: hypothetical protein H6658_07935 [Ardenticatenaceae bacterium]|nr:hypothetical protein [Ardenticatenaceae bacterium]
MHKKKVSIHGFNSMLKPNGNGSPMFAVLRGLTKVKRSQISAEPFLIELGSWSGWSW